MSDIAGSAVANPPPVVMGFAHLFQLSALNATSGNWISVNPFHVFANLDNQNAPAGRLYLLPFVPPRTITVDGFAVRVTATVGNDRMQFVAYASDPVSYVPTDRIAQEVPVNIFGGVEQHSISPLELVENRLYWVGIHNELSGTNYGVTPFGHAAPILNEGSQFTDISAAQLETSDFAFGAAPANWGAFNSSTQLPTGGTQLRMFLRLA